MFGKIRFSQVLLSACLCALAACNSREPLIVYSPHGPDILGDYEARFEAAYPEADVQWLDLGSKEAYERIRAESNRPVADVWWGGPMTMFMQAAEENLLGAYRPTWADGISSEDRDSQDRWYGTHRSPLAFMFNTRGYAPADLPQTWGDLLDPKWKGKLTFRSPYESGTMRTFIGAMILRQPSEQDGVKWLKRLHEATESYLPSPQQLFDHVKRNPELISVWLMPDIPLQRERHGTPLGFVIPPQTPVIVEGIAIVNRAPHRTRAEQFYEFVSTPDALIHQAQAYFKMPLREDLDKSQLPEEIAAQEIVPMHIDWPDFMEREAHWVALWNKNVKHGS